ncbi:MAG TPA: thioesterase domain-containing protein, partial [Burkholderiaceae bacterium]
APELGSYLSQEYEAPQGEIEEILAGIWKELLRVERVGRHDNFFELGGHSLLAVVVLNRLRNKGMHVSLASLFRHSTIASLAESILLGGDRQLSDRGVVTMREHGSEIPLFLVHEFTGDVFPLFPLSRHLRNGVPVYGLQMGEDSRLESLEALAGQHIENIRKIQPAGPYRLAGHSLGGVLAYEIARQLAGDGEGVEFLGLIDSYCPTADLGLPRTVSIHQALLMYVELTVPDLEPERWAVLRAAKDVDQALAQCKLIKLLPDELGLAELDRWAKNSSAMMTMVANYRPWPLSVPTCLINAEGHMGDRGWRTLLGDNLHIEATPGTHYGMIQAPQVAGLAQAISLALVPA